MEGHIKEVKHFVLGSQLLFNLNMTMVKQDDLKQENVTIQCHPGSMYLPCGPAKAALTIAQAGAAEFAAVATTS